MVRKLYILVTCVLFTTIFYSCVKDKNRNECITRQLIVMVQGDSNDKVQEVALYIYDSSGKFIDKKKIQPGVLTDMSKYASYKQIHFVAWGNTSNANQTISQGAPNENIALHNLSLKSLEIFNGHSVVSSPSDIFFGVKDITYLEYNTLLNIDTVYVERQVASVKITAVSLQDLLNTTDTDFHYIIEKSSDIIDFSGVLNSPNVVYKPNSMFESNGNFVAPVFLTLPSKNEAITLYIYKGSELIYSTNQDSNGNLFLLEKGKLLNILIDFRGSIKVIAKVAQWGDEYIDNEFN